MKRDDGTPWAAPALPDEAKAFLSSPGGHHAQRQIRTLHYWMVDRGLCLTDLKPEHIDEFLQAPAGRPITSLTRNDYRYKIRRYLEFLSDRQAIGFSVDWLRIRHQILPDMAEEFLASLTPTLRPATVLQYRGSLRLLHNWLTAQGIAIEQVGREDLARWFRHLHEERGQAPATRVNILAAVRSYLRALNDEGVLAEPADTLVRRSDFPKLPRYLPRPLPPGADDELRRRLQASNDTFQQALLLMRNTGMRVGELASLPVDCLRSDGTGRRFLKVPLGKLATERLVPLDDQTVELVARLRQAGRPGRTWLIETVRGRKTRQTHYQQALSEACHDLEIPDALTTHRLRHTYATTLVNGGMSLMSMMKLLGHHDYRMTLRYTEITLETVGNEYFAALKQLEQRYRVALQATPAAELDPDQALADIVRWVRKRAGSNPDAQHRASLLIRRLKSARADIRKLATSVEKGSP